MRRFLFENGLSVFFLVLFLFTLAGQSFAGQHAHNAETLAHGGESLSWIDYVLSPSLWRRGARELAIRVPPVHALHRSRPIWLVQRGSNESKQLEHVGLETKQKQRIGRHLPANGPRWARFDDWRTRVYENSLLLVMGTIFLATWFGQSLNNWRDFNASSREHDEAAISWGSYLVQAEFWEKTLQNWQSEFLAVGTMVVFTIYLRQRGSPESKPVGAPHDETGTSG